MRDRFYSRLPRTRFQRQLIHHLLPHLSMIQDLLLFFTGMRRSPLLPRLWRKDTPSGINPLTCRIGSSRIGSSRQKVSTLVQTSSAALQRRSSAVETRCGGSQIIRLSRGRRSSPALRAQRSERQRVPAPPPRPVLPQSALRQRLRAPCQVPLQHHNRSPMRDRFEQLLELGKPPTRRAAYLPMRVPVPGTAQQLHWQQWKLCWTLWKEN